MGVTAQINARIDASAKSCGDAAITAANLTTSEVVRAVWDVCAQYKDSPQKLRAWLFPSPEAQQAKAKDKVRKHKAELIENGSSMFSQLCAQYSIDNPSSLPSFSDSELEALALFDEFGAEMHMTQDDFLEASDE